MDPYLIPSPSSGRKRRLSSEQWRRPSFAWSSAEAHWLFPTLAAGSGINAANHVTNKRMVVITQPSLMTRCPLPMIFIQSLLICAIFKSFPTLESAMSRRPRGFNCTNHDFKIGEKATYIACPPKNAMSYISLDFRENRRPVFIIYTLLEISYISQLRTMKKSQWNDIPVGRYPHKHNTPSEEKSRVTVTGLLIHKLALISPAFTYLTCFNHLWNKALTYLSICKGMISQSWPKSPDQNSHFE